MKIFLDKGFGFVIYGTNRYRSPLGCAEDSALYLGLMGMGT
jgi:hypothetical protein